MYVVAKMDNKLQMVVTKVVKFEVDSEVHIFEQKFAKMNGCTNIALIYIFEPIIGVVDLDSVQ